MYPFSTIRRLTAERDASRTFADDLNRSYLYLVCKYDNLDMRLADAHFRDPKTGRLGKKGQTFD